MPSQRVVKVEMKPSMNEEFSKVNELPQDTIEVEESVVLHVMEEISNVQHCDLMRNKNMEKESIEIEEKERVEEKEILVERLCIFDSISILSKENELLDEEVNFYVNGTNSFFASEFLCVQNFGESSKDEDGKLAYKSTKTTNFFPSNSYLSFEIYFKEIKMFSLVFMKNGY
ncbi:hypothetical protein M9H77_07964 [Catharanthus roseus]|uniref:Uncharacterized protein n=1 Tax=Catharanthus roseus TaxID=4058 RepID=A0ACC0BWE3_CATRO|nr:hypothetical protein M9H77_07964 [Catharanthus roseus]